MRWPNLTVSPKDAALTLLIAALGAAVAWAVSMPVYVLLGPAVAVSIAGLAGVKTAVEPRLRSACFVILGLTVGAGFNADALGAMLRWPLAFILLGALLWVILVVCRWVLVRFFGFDRRSALLACTPGHLSFVIAFAQESGLDVARVSIVQSVRLLGLTIVVPFVAMAMGVNLGGNIAPQGQTMSLLMVLVLILLAFGVAQLFARWSVPAPVLLAAMMVSALGHLSGWAPGVLPIWMILPAYIVLGALIGTRFCGVSPAAFLKGLAAGLVTTGVAVVLAGVASVPVALTLQMPLAHVLVAFAPGGLETMIALGVVLGVVPGFVAACHIARLLILSVMLPAMMSGRFGNRR